MGTRRIADWPKGEGLRYRINPRHRITRTGALVTSPSPSPPLLLSSFRRYCILHHRQLQTFLPSIHLRRPPCRRPSEIPPSSTAASYLQEHPSSPSPDQLASAHIAQQHPKRAPAAVAPPTLPTTPSEPNRSRGNRQYEQPQKTY